MIGLISVGVFWSLLLYHVNKNKQDLRIPELKQFLRQKKDILKSQLSKYRKKLFKKNKPKNKQQTKATNSNPNNLQNQASNQKQDKQKYTFSQVSSVIKKTKLISKKKYLKKVSSAQYRAWISRDSDSIDQGQINKKDTNQENQEKYEKQGESNINGKLEESMILKDLSLSEQAQDSIMQSSYSGNLSEPRVITYNPFIYENFDE